MEKRHPVLTISRVTKGTNRPFGKEWWKVRYLATCMTHLRVDISAATLRQIVRPEEGVVDGDEYMRRIYTGTLVPMDSFVAESLYVKEHPSEGPYFKEEAIPERWKEKVGGRFRKIIFGGSLLTHKDGYQAMLYLVYFPDNGVYRWRWGTRRPELGFSFEDEAVFF
jgi:hypothetical protein